ncbi:MAG TPA: hypothetical protein VJI74_03150 [Candidatus Paceibacterota bacterium]
MTNTIIVILIVLVIAAGIFYFLAPDSLKFWQSQTAAVGDSIDTTTPLAHETILAKHQYASGTHIVAGEVNFPTPCYVLTTNAQVAESFPEQVTINFLSQTSGQVCAQVITPVRFKVSFQASQNATIKATWNGQPVVLNLIPAAAGEDLNNFELFIKG